MANKKLLTTVKRKTKREDVREELLPQRLGAHVYGGRSSSDGELCEQAYEDDLAFCFACVTTEPRCESMQRIKQRTRTWGNIASGRSISLPK